VPAERSLVRRILLSVESFLRVEQASGAALLAATAIALIWANSPWRHSYETLWQARLIAKMALREEGRAYRATNRGSAKGENDRPGDHVRDRDGENPRPLVRPMREGLRRIEFGYEPNAWKYEGLK